jgi:hypothetical protein
VSKSLQTLITRRKSAKRVRHGKASDDNQLKGNYDLVGNNTPVFFIGDGIKDFCARERLAATVAGHASRIAVPGLLDRVIDYWRHIDA